MTINEQEHIKYLILNSLELVEGRFAYGYYDLLLEIASADSVVGSDFDTDSIDWHLGLTQSTCSYRISAYSSPLSFPSILHAKPERLSSQPGCNPSPTSWKLKAV